MSLVFAFSVCASSANPFVLAQESETISAERRDAARRIFEQGERAYEVHDYELAAKAFDEAYRIAPHHASLWNAARAWERAGNRARAANAYAKYLRLAPVDAPDRDGATTSLSLLAPKLGRIEVYAAKMDAVRVNDEIVEGSSIYVNPGTHVIEGRAGDEKIIRTEVVAEGDIRSVALVQEKPNRGENNSGGDFILDKPILKVQPAPAMPLRSMVDRRPNWFGPAAIVSGAVTVVSASLLIWSGTDTLAARREFDTAPTTDKLEAGKEKQWRTNAFVGATAVSGIATGVFLSLWKWNGSATNSAVTLMPPVAGSPTQILVTGSF